MIITDDSPLRRLPANLDRKQTLFLDGIRYSVEMADLAHRRLRSTLYHLAENQAASENLDHLDFVAAVQDAWSIVDSLHRLRGLLRQTPGFKQKTPNMQLFMRQTAAVEDLRNAVQHLNHEIDKLIGLDLPVWGTLSWFAAIDQEARTGFLGCLFAGTLFKSKDIPLVNPAGKPLDLPVDLITLTAHSHTLDLSKVIKAVARLIEDLEKQLSNQFAGHPVAGGDLLLGADIQFGETKQDEESSH